MRKISIFSRDSWLPVVFLAVAAPSWAMAAERPVTPLHRSDPAFQRAGEINVDNVGGPEDQEEPPVIRSLRPAKPPAAPAAPSPAPANSPGNPANPSISSKPGQAVESAKSPSPGGGDQATTH